MTPGWRDKEARNEAAVRDMNEWTKENGDLRSATDAADTYICECGDPRCRAPISLTPAEYEEVRSDPMRFAVALDHENPELDVIVEENERFAVIEKLTPDATRVARETDPRR